MKNVPRGSGDRILILSSSLVSVWTSKSHFRLMGTETTSFTDFGDVDWSDATQTATGATEACGVDTVPALPF